MLFRTQRIVLFLGCISLGSGVVKAENSFEKVKNLYKNYDSSSQDKLFNELLGISVEQLMHKKNWFLAKTKLNHALGKASHDLLKDVIRLRLLKIMLKEEKFNDVEKHFAPLHSKAIFKNTDMVREIYYAMPSNKKELLIKRLIDTGFFDARPESLCPYFELAKRQKRAELLYILSADYSLPQKIHHQVLFELYIILPEAIDDDKIKNLRDFQLFFTSLQSADIIRRMENLLVFGKNDEARRSFLETVSRLDQMSKNDRCELTYVDAKVDRKMRKYKTAIDRFDKLATDCPEKTAIKARYLSLMQKSQIGDYASLPQFSLFVSDYPTHSFADDVLLFKAQILLEKNLVDEAQAVLAELIEKYPDGDMVDRALFLQAFYFAKSNSLENAMKSFEHIMEKNEADTLAYAQAKYWCARLSIFPDVNSMAKPVDSEIQRARISFLELIKSPSPSIYSWLAQIILTSLNEKIENYDVGESLLDEKLTGKISTELFGIHELIMNGFRTEALFLLDDIAVDKKNIDLAMQMAFFYDALNQPLDGHQKLIRCDPSLSKILSKKIPKVFNALSYPRPFRKEVAFALTKVDIPEEVVFAVMRQESGFIKEARSFAQAKGLMQLVYSSALAESKSWKLDKLDENDLYLPHINVLLGTSILHKYWQRFGNLMVGLAAYNAGPTPAKSWILKNKNAPIDTFIDTVPYKETREYLKSVGNAIFRYHDGAMSLPDIRIFSEKNLQ